MDHKSQFCLFCHTRNYKFSPRGANQQTRQLKKKRKKLSVPSEGNDSAKGFEHLRSISIHLPILAHWLSDLMHLIEQREQGPAVTLRMELKPHSHSPTNLFQVWGPWHADFRTGSFLHRVWTKIPKTFPTTVVTRQDLKVHSNFWKHCYRGRLKQGLDSTSMHDQDSLLRNQLWTPAYACVN